MVTQPRHNSSLVNQTWFSRSLVRLDVSSKQLLFICVANSFDPGLLGKHIFLSITLYQYMSKTFVYTFYNQFLSVYVWNVILELQIGRRIEDNSKIILLIYVTLITMNF